MQYPQEILPNPNYKSIDCDLSDYFVLRYTNTNNKEALWNAETNSIIVQQICSPTERIEDLSMSLLGVYRPAHVILEFTNEGKQKYMSYCAPDAEVSVPVYDADFLLNENKHYWWIPISKVHNASFTYTSNNAPYEAICTVLHTPMLWNYWHFSLRWPQNREHLKRWMKKPGKKLRNA